MLLKHSFTFGPDYPFCFDVSTGGWYVFDSRNGETIASYLTRWEAYDLARQKNGIPEQDAPVIGVTKVR